MREIFGLTPGARSRLGIPFMPSGCGDIDDGWKRQDIRSAELIILGRFRRWASGSRVTSSAANTSGVFVGRGASCPNRGMIGEPCEMSQGRLRCCACGLETTLTADLLSFAFSWMAIYLVELFPASVRTTAASFAFSGARLLAWVFPTIAGQIVTLFGRVARAALIMCSVYVIGLIVPWFMPETAGEPLPE